MGFYRENDVYPIYIKWSTFHPGPPEPPEPPKPNNPKSHKVLIICISTIGGGLLLCLLIAYIIYKCKKGRESEDLDVFVDNEPLNNSNKSSFNNYEGEAYDRLPLGDRLQEELKSEGGEVDYERTLGETKERGGGYKERKQDDDPTSSFQWQEEYQREYQGSQVGPVEESDLEVKGAKLAGRKLSGRKLSGSEHIDTMQAYIDNLKVLLNEDGLIEEFPDDKDIESL